MSNRYRFLSSALWIGVALGSFAPAWGQTEVKPGFNIFSLEQDVEIGQQSAQEIEKQLPLLNLGLVQGYVGQIGKRLAAVTEGPDFEYQFKVVNVSDVNAFALPGGFMYVNRGLIETADSEAELAGVMAHEIAHVALRHGTNQASKAYMAQAGLGILGGIFGGGSTGDMIGAIGGFGLNATFLKFSRSAEEQADVMGAQILARAGYDPMAMADFFETLREQAGRDPGSLEKFFSSHPAPADRAERIRQEKALLGSIGYSRPVGEFGNVQSQLARIAPAPSMADLAGGASKEGGGEPEAGSGRPAPGVGEIEAPSSTLVQFEKSGGLYRLRYPRNWQPLDSNQDMGVTLIPRGGVVRDQRGNSHIVFGTLVNVFEPSSSTGSRPSGPFRDLDGLERNTNRLVQWILESNSYLRWQRGTEEELLVDGARALSVVLTGQSQVTGQQERVTAVSRELPAGRLIYVLFIAPEDRYPGLQRIMEPILSSLSVNDPAVSR